MHQRTRLRVQHPRRDVIIQQLTERLVEALDVQHIEFSHIAFELAQGHSLYEFVQSAYAARQGHHRIRALTHKRLALGHGVRPYHFAQAPGEHGLHKARDYADVAAAARRQLLGQDSHRPLDRTPADHHVAVTGHQAGELPGGPVEVRVYHIARRAEYSYPHFRKVLPVRE